eukprot:6204826-Pleurochrysis_carterae.AAC.1
MKVAATKPVRSPTTPPPSATMHVSRWQRCSSMKSSMRSLTNRSLDDSPGSITYEMALTPAASNASRSCWPYRAKT